MKIEWSETDDRDDLKSSGMHGLIHSMDLKKMTYVPISSVVISGKRNRVKADDVIDLTWDANSEYHPNILKFIYRKPLPVFVGKPYPATGAFARKARNFDFGQTSKLSKSKWLGTDTYNQFNNVTDDDWDIGYDDLYPKGHVKTLSSVLEFLEYYAEYRGSCNETPEEIYQQVAIDLNYKLSDEVESLNV
jgi:hypothetical protein